MPFLAGEPTSAGHFTLHFTLPPEYLIGDLWELYFQMPEQEFWAVDGLVTYDDLSTLAPDGARLNTTGRLASGFVSIGIIDGFFRLLNMAFPRYPYIAPSAMRAYVSQGIIANISGDRINLFAEDVSQLLVPMFVGNNHWILAVCNAKTMRIRVYDSYEALKNDKQRYIEQLRLVYA